MVRSEPNAPRDPAEIARELASLEDAQFALRLNEDLGAPPAELLAALRQEASLHYHADAARARRIAERSAAIAGKLADPLAIGWAQRTMAEALLFSGRLSQAEAAYRAAQSAWREAGASALRGQLLAAHTTVLALLGRMDEVESTAREAEALLAEAGDRVYLAKLAMNVGSIHFQRDRYSDALAAYEKARDLFRELRVRDESVVGLEVNRAVALTQLDRAADALELFDRLARDCRRRGFDLLLAQVRMNSGYVHALRGDFDEALEHLGAATAYFKNTDHPAFLGSCLINRAEVYQQLNLHGEALEMCAAAAGLFEAAGLAYDRALALGQSAVSHLAAGRPEAALEPVRAATSLFRRERNPARVALMTYIGAEALARTGRRAAARRRARAAFEVFRDLGLVRWEAAAGSLVLRLGEREDPARRRRFVQDLLRKVPGRVYPLQALGLLEQLGELEERSGQPRRAAQAYARAVRRLESLRLRVPTEDSKIAFLSDKTHLFDRLLRLELARTRPRPPRLFDWMERARAQSLWDRLREPARWSARGGKGRAASDAQRREISWLHARVSRLELGTAEERARARALRGDLLRAERAYERSLRAEREARGGRSAASALAPVTDLGALHRALARGWGFLSYHLGPDFALAAGVSQAGPFWCPLAPDLARHLEQLSRRLDFQWSAAALASARRALAAREAVPAPARPSSGVAGADGRSGGEAGADALLRAATDEILGRLHGLLWQPLLERGLSEDLGWVISPHGALHRIPLHALRGPRGYLAEHTPIRLAPSGRVWREIAGRRGPRPRRAYLAALPAPELPAVAREVERVRERLEAWDTLVDLSPTRATLAREAARAGIVHIAAHGELRTDNPAFSCLHLADGPLFVHDLASLRLSGAVVVLTACSSGRGAAPAGDEWIGLARGFLQAGASQVVASLWPIEDQATGDLMDSFYAGLAAELAPEEALRQAMLALRATRPHPWHWAAFAVLGGGTAARSREAPQACSQRALVNSAEERYNQERRRR